MDTSFLGVPWFVWGLLCLASWKTSGQGERRLQYLILRWYHALVWVLLAVSFFLRSGKVLGGSATANVLALLALGVYLIFMGTLLRSSR